MAENLAELLALAERVEAAAGPDRELDAAVAVAISPEPTARVIWWKGERRFLNAGPGRNPMAGALGKGTQLGWIFQLFRPTHSLDAAMALVPEGNWPEGSLGTHKDQRSSIEIHAPDAFDPIGTGWAATPALALTAAALRARAATLTNDGGDNG